MPGRDIPDKSTGSARSGLWYVFEDRGHRIALWVSALSGKERVYVDDHEVARSRNVRLETYYDLKVGNSRYRVELRVLDVLRGESECLLLRDGMAVACVTTHCKPAKWRLQDIVSLAVIAALVLAARLKAIAWPIPLTVFFALAIVNSIWRGDSSGYVFTEHRRQGPPRVKSEMD